MQSLPEWSFTFTIFSSREPDCLKQISEKIMDEAIGWAEQRQLGIGGGYKISDGTGSQKSVFNFGLTITVDGHSISHQTAADLFAFLQSAVIDRGCAMQGGFSEFNG
ncbi:MAG: hypothetical protein ACKOS8_02765 [Gemmataceae bacterium]